MSIFRGVNDRDEAEVAGVIHTFQQFLKKMEEADLELLLPQPHVDFQNLNRSLNAIFPPNWRTGNALDKTILKYETKVLD